MDVFLVIQYIVDVRRLWLMLVKNGVTGQSTVQV